MPGRGARERLPRRWRTELPLPCPGSLSSPGSWTSPKPPGPSCLLPTPHPDLSHGMIQARARQTRPSWCPAPHSDLRYKSQEFSDLLERAVQLTPGCFTPLAHAKGKGSLHWPRLSPAQHLQAEKPPLLLSPGVRPWARAREDSRNSSCLSHRSPQGPHSWPERRWKLPSVGGLLTSSLGEDKAGSQLDPTSSPQSPALTGESRREGTGAGNGGGGGRRGAAVYHLRRTTEFRHLLPIELVKPHMRPPPHRWASPHSHVAMAKQAQRDEMTPPRWHTQIKPDGCAQHLQRHRIGCSRSTGTSRALKSDLEPRNVHPKATLSGPRCSLSLQVRGLRSPWSQCLEMAKPGLFPLFPAASEFSHSVTSSNRRCSARSPPRRLGRGLKHHFHSCPR